MSAVEATEPTTLASEQGRQGDRDGVPGPEAGRGGPSGQWTSLDEGTTVLGKPPAGPGPDRPRRGASVLAIAVLLALLGAGAYFGVTKLTGSSSSGKGSGSSLNPSAAPSVSQPSVAAPPQSTNPFLPPSQTTNPSTAPPSSSSTETSQPSSTESTSSSSSSPSATPSSSSSSAATPSATSPSSATTSSSAAPPPPTTQPTSSSPAPRPQDVVNEYFAAINARDYALAWSLGGKNVHNGSYSSFVQGFAGTAFDTVTILSVSGNTVAVDIDARQTDGSHRFFAGTYTVRNGVIVGANIR